ncbi:CDPK-related kinase 3 [Zea mays]|uniref:CDPK-related kinase 3 n=2 Tax=Zea mays TaxID=4577 RepID=A0A3L6F7V1_MAIZE|nr:CDPK-related kinase 3 [Zea mays]PWZ52945.1 CDPK-related kinase 3 [Zea mays]
MGQCYARNVHGVDADDGGMEATTIMVSAAGGPEDAASVGGGQGGEGRRSARPSPAGKPRGGRAGATPERLSTAGSPWTGSPLDLPDGIAPSPATSVSMPRRFFRRPFAPPSPAKHIKASLARRLDHRSPPSASQVPRPPVEVPIPEQGASGAGEVERELDKSFGYDRHFAAKYELGKEVGRGHFGHTCLACPCKGDMRGQVMAVKGDQFFFPMVLALALAFPRRMTTAISIEDVRKEVKILKALSGHSNLVKFYDACEDALNVYIIMELCEGGELLDRILSRGGRYNEGDAKIIVEQILKVVAFCHLQGVVHRDLKPEGDQGVNATQWLHNEPVLVTVSGDGSVGMWDVTLGQPCVRHIVAHTRCANAVAVAPNDKYLCTGGSDQKVAVAPNDKYLCIGGSDQKVVSCLFVLLVSYVAYVMSYWKRFYIITEVGVHILIGVFHILCKEMIDMLPEIIELFR